MEFKEYEHNPPHLFKKNSKYFVTSSIYNSIKLIKSYEAKNKLLSYIIKSVEHFNWKLEDWVILDNHYHLMLEVLENPVDLRKIFGNIHKFSALWIKKNVKHAKNTSKIWHNYWDTCITYERSYFARLNYIWYNPVKHGYVEKPEDWEFGSYRQRFEKEKEYLHRVNKDYPCDKVKIEDCF
jgi:putative transposase